jgi:hypothetical protein
MGHPGAWVSWYERMFDPKDLSFRPVAEMSDHQRRALPVVERWRNIRRTYQEEGRRRARQGDPLHQAGCMLYWAEGTKNRNTACVTNSDVHLIRFFRRFLAESFGLGADDLEVRLHVYMGNGLTLREIEQFWLDALDLPRSLLRKHAINVRPTSSNGQRGKKLPHGVCDLRVKRSTRLVQHIYGAIQEYGDFEEPRWVG